MTLLLGLLGLPVAHSRSPAMHRAALAAERVNGLYLPFAVAPEALGRAIDGAEVLGFKGLNVTSPHKEAAASLVSKREGDAAVTGSVNTIHFCGGERVGHDTDAWALRRLAPAAPAGGVALVLGAGGAARSAAHAAAAAGWRVVVANRDAARARALVRSVGGGEAVALADAPGVLGNVGLVVQATRVGHLEDASPLPDGARWRAGAVAVELVYAPRRTRFLRQAEAAGARCVEGLDVLALQGFRALELWLGRPLGPGVAATMLRAAQEAA